MKDELSSRAHARCKGCDRKFYPKWYEERKQYEDICWSCINPTEDWDFINQLVRSDTIPDDLHQLDEYHVHGEGAMGDLSLFDRHD
jgi:hypothetical protein